MPGTTFSDEDKVEQNTNYFDIGTHEVIVDELDFDTDATGRDYVNISVIGKNNESANVRMWFHTPGAKKYTFNTLRGIAVHSAAEPKKEAVRKHFTNVKTLDDLSLLAEKTITGGDCWLQVKDSGRTYEKDGVEKKSYDRDLYHYQPKELTEDILKGAQPVSTDDAEPFGDI